MDNFYIAEAIISNLSFFFKDVHNSKSTGLSKPPSADKTKCINDNAICIPTTAESCRLGIYQVALVRILIM